MEISKQLNENNIQSNPFGQFNIWLNDAVQTGIVEPTAMVLSTAGRNLRPSSRVVLLKKINERGFVFFTNYNSRKGKQIDENSYASLLFLWKELERQVRIEGQLEKVLPEESEIYFNSRPELSRVSAIISPQSQVISSREDLEKEVIEFTNKRKKIARPAHWGGYILIPDLIEFWQGRENRLHDRLQYILIDSKWIIERLAP